MRELLSEDDIAEYEFGLSEEAIDWLLGENDGAEDDDCWQDQEDGEVNG